MKRNSTDSSAQNETSLHLKSNGMILISFLITFPLINGVTNQNNNWNQESDYFVS